MHLPLQVLDLICLQCSGPIPRLLAIVTLHGAWSLPLYLGRNPKICLRAHGRLVCLFVSRQLHFGLEIQVHFVLYGNTFWDTSRMPLLIISNRHGYLSVDGHFFEQVSTLISYLLDDVCIDGDILYLVVIDDPVYLVQMAHHIWGQTWFELIDTDIGGYVVDEVQTHVVMDHGVFECTQTLFQALGNPSLFQLMLLYMVSCTLVSLQLALE